MSLPQAERLTLVNLDHPTRDNKLPPTQVRYEKLILSYLGPSNYTDLQTLMPDLKLTTFVYCDRNGQLYDLAFIKDETHDVVMKGIMSRQRPEKARKGK